MAYQYNSETSVKNTATISFLTGSTRKMTIENAKPNPTAEQLDTAGFISYPLTGADIDSKNIKVTVNQTNSVVYTRKQ